MDDDGDALQRMLLKAGCHEAVIRFFAALDAGRLEAVAAAMAVEGVWHRQGVALHGPSGVAAALASRPAGRVTAHLVQNVVVDLDLDDHDEAALHYLVLTYRHDAPASVPAGPAPLDRPLSIAAYDDRLRRVGDDWLVLERRSRVLFAGS